MDLMIDPACEYNTFADALKVGTGLRRGQLLLVRGSRTRTAASRSSPTASCASSSGRRILHRRARARTLEPHVDLIVADGTDFVRVDADYDGGITGAMKIAHAAEGFGLDCEIHAPGPAHRHCMASIRNTNYYELGLRRTRSAEPARSGARLQDPTATPTSSTRSTRTGASHVPEGPGLGVEHRLGLGEGASGRPDDLVVRIRTSSPMPGGRPPSPSFRGRMESSCLGCQWVWGGAANCR